MGVFIKNSQELSWEISNLYYEEEKRTVCDQGLFKNVTVS